MRHITRMYTILLIGYKRASVLQMPPFLNGKMGLTISAFKFKEKPYDKEAKAGRKEDANWLIDC